MMRTFGGTDGIRTEKKYCKFTEEQFRERTGALREPDRIMVTERRTLRIQRAPGLEGSQLISARSQR
jgi:hypothetical protein